MRVIGVFIKQKEITFGFLPPSLKPKRHKAMAISRFFF